MLKNTALPVLGTGDENTVRLLHHAEVYGQDGGLYVRLAHCLCFRSALLGKLGEFVGAAKSATATLRALAASERAAEPPRSGSAERARMEQLRAQAQHNLAIAVRMHRDRAAAAAATAAHDRVEVRL